MKIHKEFLKIINFSFSCVRYIYNKCVDLLKNPDFKNTRKFLRDRLLNSKSEFNMIPEKFKDDFEKVPYDVRDTAIIDFCNAYEFEKYKEKTSGNPFEMKFRKKNKMLSEALNLNHKHLRIKDGKISAFSKLWNGLFFSKYREELPEKITHDIKLLKTKDGKFYLCIPEDVETKNYENRKKCVSLDPGIRTFMTCFDNEGNSYKFGNEDIEKINKFSRIARRMRNGIKRKISWDKENRGGIKNISFVETDKSLSKASYKMEAKIKNKIKDCHHKVSKFLCLNNEKVIIPKFATKDIAQTHKLGEENNKRMYTWAHYKFRNILRFKGLMHNNKVVIGTEEYTSKTCTNCFKIDSELGSKEIYNCKNCKHVLDRDVNGARNIMILNFNLEN